MTIGMDTRSRAETTGSPPTVDTYPEALSDEMILSYLDSDASFASLAKYEADGHTLPPKLVDAMNDWAIASLRGGSFNLAMIHFFEQHTTKDESYRLNGALVEANDNLRISTLPPITQGVEI